MKKGFTLIELLAVIVILAIVLLITIMSVDSVLLNSKNNLNVLQKQNIEEAAKAYYLKEGMLFEDECVSVYKLLSKGYIEGEKVINTETKQEMNGYVKITYNNNQYNYTYQEDTCEIYEPIINPIVGSTPSKDENGNITVGSTFKVKVNNNSEPLTFFVLSYDGEYVNLIAEQNITSNGKFMSEPQDGDEWYTTKNLNSFGPQKAYTYLSTATSNWTNIPIIESFNYLDEGNQGNSTYGYQSIITEKDEETGKYITTITPLSLDYGNPVTYENMRARLPYLSEITTNTSCEMAGTSSPQGSCPLWMVNYLYSDSTSEQYYNSANGKVNSTGNNQGYWTLSSLAGSASIVHYVCHDGYVSNFNVTIPDPGVRPVITVSKSTLLNEMK